ncbi:hypothetical protein [Saccharopolyspora oryzae]|uniref:hypothetical protein n=1 Tax=Saccharopolyspora oryzae TaxID=2997343 RepID=UPI0022EA6C7A|nr:hypothetical protein [Saccharopolyspora oryzae]
MHPAVVAQRGHETAVRGEGRITDRRSEHGSPGLVEDLDETIGVAGREDRRIPRRQRRVGSGRGLDPADHGPPGLLPQHHQIPGPHLAKRGERELPARHRYRPGRAVRRRRRDQLRLPGRGQPPMQQSHVRRSQHVHFPCPRHEHRDAVADTGPTEIGPRRCVGEADAHPTRGILRSDHGSTAGNSSGCRCPDVRHLLACTRRT